MTHDAFTYNSYLLGEEFYNTIWNDLKQWKLPRLMFLGRGPRIGIFCSDDSFQDAIIQYISIFSTKLLSDQ